jgi:hypothetical protein
MSKRDLKKYINELTKEQLEEQILELYENSVLSKYIITLCLTLRRKAVAGMQAKISSEYFSIQTVPNVKAKDASFRCPVH